MWTDFLRADEQDRLIEIDAIRGELTAEYRRIYDRCRKRMNKERENSRENTCETGDKTTS